MVQELLANFTLALSIVILFVVLCGVHNVRKNSLGGTLGNILRFLVFGFVIVAVDGILLAMQLAGMLEVNLITSSVIGFLALVAAIIVFVNLNNVRNIITGAPNNA